jgi:hypothetical protein
MSYLLGDDQRQLAPLLSQASDIRPAFLIPAALVVY